MAFKLPGIKVPHNKNTDGISAVRITPPKAVAIPTSMHIGAPSKPVVKVGDQVFVGTLIAEKGGFVSSPIYSSVSGTVTAITETMLISGNTSPTINIESDGQMTLDSSIVPPAVTDTASFINAIEKSGIVGLGGAGFPTFIKFPNQKPIDELIINGAECEPFITSDSVTMTDKPQDIAFAINTITKYFDIKRVIIAIEKNKPRAIESMNKIASENSKVEVMVLPSIYPQGGEKVLIYHTTGKQVPTGKLPIDVGCVVCNSSTVAEMGKFLKTGIPLVERTVTVDGGAVAEPKNVIVPIGTPIKDVFDFCGGFTSQPAKVLYGGPMMGITIPDITAPVLKNTNALLAFTEKQAFIPKTTACIKCGSCNNHCPFNINPVALFKAFKDNDFEAMQKAGAELCMECGCCSYNCPAKIPIVQNNKLAKAALRAHKEAK